jgi:hypothetical protein
MATVLSSRLGFAPLALPRSRSPPSARAAQHRPALALSDRRSSRPPLPLQRPLRGLAFRPLAAPSPRDLSLQQSATAGDALGSGPDASNSFDEVRRPRSRTTVPQPLPLSPTPRTRSSILKGGLYGISSHYSSTPSAVPAISHPAPCHSNGAAPPRTRQFRCSICHLQLSPQLHIYLPYASLFNKLRHFIDGHEL